MSESDYFPEVSNWIRNDPEQYDSEITDVWVNEPMQIKLRLRSVNGPFGTCTSKYVVERRPWGVSTASGDPWGIVGDSPFESKATAERAAYQYAKQNNTSTND